jgi:hypothetical protein
MYLYTSAAMAGSLASLFTNPLDLVKLRLQVQRQAAVAHGTSDVIYSGVLDGLIKILRYVKYTVARYNTYEYV